jgi:hypothetical protein
MLLPALKSKSVCTQMNAPRRFGNVFLPAACANIRSLSFNTGSLKESLRVPTRYLQGDFFVMRHALFPPGALQPQNICLHALSV